MGLLVNHTVPTPLGFDAPQAYVSNRFSFQVHKEYNPDDLTWTTFISTTMYVGAAKGAKPFTAIPLMIVWSPEDAAAAPQTLLYAAMVAQHFPSAVSDDV